MNSTRTNENVQLTNENNDLTDLLNEAKLTIIHLQQEMKSLKSEIEILRQQNREYLTQIETMKNESRVKSPQNQPQIASENDKTELKTPALKEDPVPIPLEPVIIVKESKSMDPLKQSPNTTAKQHENVVKQLLRNHSFDIDHEDKSLVSDQTSQSENTFVV